MGQPTGMWATSDGNGSAMHPTAQGHIRKVHTPVVRALFDPGHANGNAGRAVSPLALPGWSFQGLSLQ